MRGFIVAMVLAAAGSIAAHAQEAKTVGEDIVVPHGADTQIFVRNKRPEGVQNFKSDRIAIMMHGATYPGTAFDLPVGGKSWMDYMAARGFDVYALDLPGYGRSTRPSDHGCPGRPECAVHGARTRRPRPRRGGGLRSQAARRRQGQSHRLVLGHDHHGQPTPPTTPARSSGSPSTPRSGCAPRPRWCKSRARWAPTASVSRDQALGRWLTGVPEDKKADAHPGRLVRYVGRCHVCHRPQGQGKTLRAPNGVVQDGLDYWGATPPKTYWDPAKITAPVLLVLGEWDRDTPLYMAQALYPLLTNAAWKRHAVLSEGTHTILMEKNRMLLLRTVQQFLEEEPPTATATQ